jgi:hypothetical protein
MYSPFSATWLKMLRQRFRVAALLVSYYSMLAGAIARSWALPAIRGRARPRFGQLDSGAQTAACEVSVVKHAHHKFDIDHPGRTPFATAEAGAFEVAKATAGADAKVRQQTRYTGDC